MEPALTPKDWERAIEEIVYDAAYMASINLPARRRQEMAVYFLEGGLPHGSKALHAAAALCLHGQPFGFTWEDVRELRGAGLMMANEFGDGWLEVLDSIADRIEALLPPEEG